MEGCSLSVTLDTLLDIIILVEIQIPGSLFNNLRFTIRVPPERWEKAVLHHPVRLPSSAELFFAETC